MNYEVLKTGYPVIDSTVELCKPRFEEIVKSINIDLLAKEKPVLTERQEEVIFVDCVFNLVRSMYNYVEKTDSITKSAVSFKKTGFIVEVVVNREGNLYDLVTDVIVAGGYNIQIAHYRYITKTDLPRARNSTALDPIQKAMRKMSEVEKIEKKMLSNEASIKNLLEVKIPEQEKEYEEYINTSLDKCREDFAKKHPLTEISNFSPEKYKKWVDESAQDSMARNLERAKDIKRFWIPYYLKDVKNLRKRNEVLQQKLKDLKENE